MMLSKLIQSTAVFSLVFCSSYAEASESVEISRLLKNALQSEVSEGTKGTGKIRQILGYTKTREASLYATTVAEYEVEFTWTWGSSRYTATCNAGSVSLMTTIHKKVAIGEIPYVCYRSFTDK